MKAEVNFVIIQNHRFLDLKGNFRNHLPLSQSLTIGEMEMPETN